MSVAITSQKEVLKKVKAIHHDVKELKVPQINFGKIHLQVQEMNKVQKEAQKYFKLSQGMLNAAFKLEAVLDEHLAQTNTH